MADHHHLPGKLGRLARSRRDATTDDQDTKSDFSNYGDTIHLIDPTTPDTGIVSAYPEGQYATWNSTSMATPFDSAALLLSEHLELTVGDVLDALASAALSLEESDSEHAGVLGAGRVDVVVAVGRD